MAVLDLIASTTAAPSAVVGGAEHARELVAVDLGASSADGALKLAPPAQAGPDSYRWESIREWWRRVRRRE